MWMALALQMNTICRIGVKLMHSSEQDQNFYSVILINSIHSAMWRRSDNQFAPMLPYILILIYITQFDNTQNSKSSRWNETGFSDSNVVIICYGFYRR